MLDVLVVDDDELIRRTIADALMSAGHRVTEAVDGEDAMMRVGAQPFDLAVCDVHMPKLGGTALLRRLRHEAPNVSVVMMTSFGRISDVLSTLRDGAIDYITKPFDPDTFAINVVGPIAERRALMKKFEATRAGNEVRDIGCPLVGESLSMQRLVRRLDVVAGAEAGVLITGAAGTGKKLVARTQHARSARRDGPFMIIPCASLGDLMLESELRELSDPSALRNRDEWFRAAEGGTLVLDGIDELPIGAQSALLRVISEPHARARRTIDWKPTGVRVVSLSRTPASTLRDERGFLEPLFFRLNAMELTLPTLREREGDLYGLVSHFLREHTPPRRRMPGLTPLAWKALALFPFTGNLSQLSWVIEHALALSGGGEVDVVHLPAEVRGQVG